MSLPSKVTVPLVGCTSRSMTLPIVVLPLPHSPISEMTSPGLRSKLTLRSAGVSAAAPAGRTVELGDLVDLQRAHLPLLLLADLPARDLWPGLISSNGGVSAHFGERERAPVPEAAPGGRVDQRRRAAGYAGQRRLVVPHSDLGQRGEQRLGVGVQRVVHDHAGLALSASRPAYMIAMESAICARIDRSWVIAMMPT